MSKLNEYLENIDNNWFCTEVYTSIESRPAGTWGFCCRAKDLPYDVFNTSIAEHYNSDLMKQVRTEMLSSGSIDNKPVMQKYCETCIITEKAGLRSLRTDRSPVIKSLLPDNEILREGLVAAVDSALANDGYVDISKAGIYLIELKSYGNLCNLKCLMCDELASSSIAAEMKKHKEIGLDGKLIQNTVHNVFEKSDKQKFFDDLRVLLPRTFSIKFTGGEPLMMPSVLEVMRFVVNEGYAKDLQMSTITNGTVINEEFIELTKHFKTNRIIFSFEGTEGLDEYMRKGTVFSEKIKNIQYIMNNVPRGIFHINTVIQALNVGYMDDLYLFGAKHNLFVHEIVLTKPSYLSVQVLPKAIKEMYYEKYISFFNYKSKNIWKSFDQFNNLKTILLDDTTFTEKERLIEFEKFKEYIRRKDKQRKENIFYVLPELKEYF